VGVGGGGGTDVALKMTHDDGCPPTPPAQASPECMASKCKAYGTLRPHLSVRLEVHVGSWLIHDKHWTPRRQQAWYGAQQQPKPTATNTTHSTTLAMEKDHARTLWRGRKGGKGDANHHAPFEPRRMARAKHSS
jgi:hypothetical protein